MDKLNELGDYLRNYIKTKEAEILAIRHEIEGVYVALAKVCNIQATEQAEQRYKEKHNA